MRLYDPQRVKTPLKRTNPKKGPNEDPRWKPISWEEAFEIVVGELNLGQYRLEIERLVKDIEIVGLNRIDGMLISPDQFLELVR